jgi:hypothetical protein
VIDTLPSQFTVCMVFRLPTEPFLADSLTWRSSLKEVSRDRGPWRYTVAIVRYLIYACLVAASASCPYARLPVQAKQLCELEIFMLRIVGTLARSCVNAVWEARDEG